MNSPSQAIKRKRTDDLPRTKINAPRANPGTKKMSTGLSVIQKTVRVEKPKFDKAIWVSRFAPESTNEEIIDWISKEIPTKDIFQVHKLVKKDRDVSTLRFVSYKIEVSQRDFETMMNPDMWPEEVLVREFFSQKKTLGDFFPALDAPKNQKQSQNTADSTETNPKSPPQKAISSNTSTIKSPSATISTLVDLLSPDGMEMQ